jgi:hypothetical protein
MAIGWLTVLKSVPWTEVIANAPRVAEGARKLWHAVGGRPAPVPVADPDAGSASAPEAQLQVRLTAAESALTELHAQMLASSALIRDLADQNARLVEGIEAARLRERRLAGLVLAVAAVALAALALALLR